MRWWGHGSPRCLFEPDQCGAELGEMGQRPVDRLVVAAQRDILLANGDALAESGGVGGVLRRVLDHRATPRHN